MPARPTFSPTFDVRQLPALRRRLGLTQTELAHRLGVRADEISRLERALAPGELLDRLVAAVMEAMDGER